MEKPVFMRDMVNETTHEVLTEEISEHPGVRRDFFKGLLKDEKPPKLSFRGG
jgi:hypothetical protein